MKSNEVNSTEFYHNLLKAFIETGEVPDASLYADDALTMYLYITMSDVRVASQVLSDEIAARIFMDTMMQFVSQSLQRRHSNTSVAVQNVSDCKMRNSGAIRSDATIGKR